MAVDEQIARAWERLGHKEVHEGLYWHPDEHWEVIPDPATQPWEWVKAFNAAGWDVTFDHREAVRLHRDEYGEISGRLDGFDSTIREWEVLMTEAAHAE